MAASADWAGDPGGFRSSENEVRLLLIEHCQDYTALLCETLERTAKGRFELRSTVRLEEARCEVEDGGLDAVLVDLTDDADTETRRVRIDEASALATRVPVIVLTGEDAHEDANAGGSVEVVHERIERSRLPDEILRAVRRHRRLGPCGGGDPVVVRDPLRACARLFARLRSSLRS